MLSERYVSHLISNPNPTHTHTHTLPKTGEYREKIHVGDRSRDSISRTSKNSWRASTFRVEAEDEDEVLTELATQLGNMLAHGWENYVDHFLAWKRCARPRTERFQIALWNRFAVWCRTYRSYTKNFLTSTFSKERMVCCQIEFLWTFAMDIDTSTRKLERDEKNVRLTVCWQHTACETFCDQTYR